MMLIMILIKVRMINDSNEDNKENEDNNVSEDMIIMKIIIKVIVI